MKPLKGRGKENWKRKRKGKGKEGKERGKDMGKERECKSVGM